MKQENYESALKNYLKTSGDSVVDSIAEKWINRSVIGKKKYGTTLDRDDLSITQWIDHAIEELMDGINYLEKTKRELLKNHG